MMKRERRKIGIRKKLYEVILQPIQGEERAHDKAGPQREGDGTGGEPDVFNHLRVFFFQERRPGAEARRVAAHGDDGTEEEGPKEGVRFEFWEGESREEEEEGVRLEAVDGAGDVGPGDARRFCGVATAERGEFAFLGMFTFVAASAIVARAVRVGVSNVRMRVRVTVATADLLPET